jgi:amino acid permease
VDKGGYDQLKGGEGGDDAHPVDMDAIGQGTMMSSFAALANTLLGAGILGLPGAFGATGYVLGCILLGTFACTSAFGLHLLYSCANKIGIPSSFGGVCDASVPSLSWVVDAAVAIKCFGVATSYLIVVGDGMPDVVEGTSRIVWVLVGFSLVAPLAFLRTLTALRFTSTFSLIFVAFTTGLVVVYAIVPSLSPCGDDDNNECGPVVAAKVNSNTFSKLSVFIFGFTCHQNAFSTLHNELREPTLLRANGVIAMSVGCALFMYLCISLAGYSIFGSEVPSDILQGFPDGNPLFSVARTLVSILVCFCYPLQAHPARASILALLRRTGKPPLVNLANSKASHWIVTTLFLLASLGIALIVTDLGVVLSFVGATGSTTITFILPGACYYKLFPEPHLKRTLALCQCALGCCIVPFALYFIFAGGASE